MYGNYQQQQQPNQQRPMQVNASIQPQQMYPQQFTRQAQNMAAAQGVPAIGDLRSQFQSSGVSGYSPLMQRGMGGLAGGMMAGGLANAATIGMNHGFANAQQGLAGQQARDAEAQAWGNLALNQQQFNNQLAMQRQQQMLGYLQQLYGGLMG